jgi:hypothetical protein
MPQHAPHRTAVALSLAALLLWSVCPGCNSSDPDGPQTPTNSSVSLFLNGGAYSNTRLDLLDNVRGASLNTSTRVTTAILDALGTFSSGETKRVVLTLTVPTPAPGTYAWTDPKGAVLTASGLFLSVYGADQSTATWQPVQGSSTVTLFGGVGEQITGSFNGTLRNTVDGAIINVSNGLFTITRSADQ